MKKCDKNLDELCDKTNDLEQAVQELTDITAELVRLQKSRPRKIVSQPLTS